MNKLRLLLLPIASIYGFITATRNLAYRFGILKSYIIPTPSICVGNLAVGGTGKTPHVAYITSLLEHEFSISILSRGYGRKTKGFIYLDETATSIQVGDEPLFYHKTFPAIHVAVCESRKTGYQKLQMMHNTDVLILDDAFQHRAIQAGLNILLTEYNHPFFEDFMLPAGNLREWKIGRKRAQMILVTKCPENLNHAAKNKFNQRLKFDTNHIYYSSIEYGKFISFGSEAPTNEIENILLVTGISNPSPLKKHLETKFHVELMRFPDHYAFTLEDIQKIHKKFDTFAVGNKVIMTTEKDFMRLQHPDFSTVISSKPWFYQRITVKIDREQEFKKVINNYVRAI
jgi:tetraacyldisaccharide 4'-kinase